MRQILSFGDAFGWETESRAKVGILQDRENNPTRYLNRCLEAKLIINGSYRPLYNLPKIVGYLPGVNILVGFFLIRDAEKFPTSSANRNNWKVRGVATILTGPLLIIVDLAKYIYDMTIAVKYEREHPGALGAFDTPHEHSLSHWPGHPVDCLNEEGRRVSTEDFA